jgi:hypothetical protein
MDTGDRTKQFDQNGILVTDDHARASQEFAIARDLIRSRDLEGARQQTSGPGHWRSEGDAVPCTA